jgi:hypothetical protein
VAGQGSGYASPLTGQVCAVLYNMAWHGTHACIQGILEVMSKQALMCSFDFSNYFSWLLENSDINDSPFQVIQSDKMVFPITFFVTFN